VGVAPGEGGMEEKILHNESFDLPEQSGQEPQKGVGEGRGNPTIEKETSTRTAFRKRTKGRAKGQGSGMESTANKGYRGPSKSRGGQH